MKKNPTTITTSTTATLIATTDVSNLAAVLMPRFSRKAMSRHSSTANRSTTWPSPVPGAPSIQAGSPRPSSSTRKPK